MAEAEQQGEQQQVVVFELDTEEHAVPIQDVLEVVRVPDIIPVPNAASYLAGIINLRGRVIPVVDLEKRFSLERQSPVGDDRHIIVVDVPDAPFGVLVDQVTEVLRIASDAVQATPSSVSSKIGGQYVAGVVVTSAVESEGDAGSDDDSESDAAEVIEQAEDRVVLILNLRDLLTMEEVEQVAKSSEGAVAADAPAPEEASAKDGEEDA